MKDNKNPIIHIERINAITDLLLNCKHLSFIAKSLGYETNKAKTNNKARLEKHFFNQGLKDKIVIHFNSYQKLFIFYNDNERQALIYD